MIIDGKSHNKGILPFIDSSTEQWKANMMAFEEEESEAKIDHQAIMMAFEEEESEEKP
jgi:hypothetical protein